MPFQKLWTRASTLCHKYILLFRASGAQHYVDIYIYNINNFGYSGGSGRKIPYPTRDHSNRLITRFGSDGYFRIRVDSVSLSSVGESGGWVGFLGSCTALLLVIYANNSINTTFFCGGTNEELTLTLYQVVTGRRLFLQCKYWKNDKPLVENGENAIILRLIK